MIKSTRIDTVQVHYILQNYSIYHTEKKGKIFNNIPGKIHEARGNKIFSSIGKKLLFIIFLET